MIRVVRFGLLPPAIVSFVLGCQIPYTCDSAAGYAPDAGPGPNPGGNGLPRECQPLDGRCDPMRCTPREHLTPAPECDCVPDYVPDAGEPI